MDPYGNASGESGVVAYAIGPDWIDVEFQDGWIYRYTHASTGASHVEAMKQFARAGRGLCTYISRNVGASYESKFEA